MPVEIRQLHINIKINERENRNSDDPNARKQERDASEDAIVAECVEQTLAIIEQNQER